MKMAAPGLSGQALVRMFDQRTVHFGRVSIEFIYPTILLISLYYVMKSCLMLMYLLYIISGGFP